MPSTDTVPDRDMAEWFLKWLDHTATEFTFQVFDDNKERADKKLAKVLHGTLNARFAELCRHNANGCGISVTINETDLKGRSAATIKRVRAVFLDLDRTPIDPVLSCKLAPHIIVESSPGKFQVFWLTKDLPKDRFSAVQSALA